jgi:hypothetical protein
MFVSSLASFVLLLLTAIAGVEALSCPAGQCNLNNTLCCDIGYIDSDGICCPNGTVSAGGICCDLGQINVDGLCCATGQVNADGICCSFGEVNVHGACCDSTAVMADGNCCPSGPLTSDRVCCTIGYACGATCCPFGSRYRCLVEDSKFSCIFIPLPPVPPPRGTPGRPPIVFQKQEL